MLVYREKHRSSQRWLESDGSLTLRTYFSLAIHDTKRAQSGKLADLDLERNLKPRPAKWETWWFT